MKQKKGEKNEQRKHFMVVAYDITEKEQEKEDEKEKWKKERERSNLPKLLLRGFGFLAAAICFICLGNCSIERVSRIK